MLYAPIFWMQNMGPIKGKYIAETIPWTSKEKKNHFFFYFAVLSKKILKHFEEKYLFLTYHYASFCVQKYVRVTHALTGNMKPLKSVCLYLISYPKISNYRKTVLLLIIYCTTWNLERENPSEILKCSKKNFNIGNEKVKMIILDFWKNIHNTLIWSFLWNVKLTITITAT